MEALHSDGHEAVDVSDGGQLLRHLTSLYRLRPDPEPIDMVVTDIRMPVCSGLEIVQGLRDADWTTPVVIMTAFGDAHTRAQAALLGAVLLDKPFKMITLRSIVRDLLQRSAQIH